MNSEIIEKKIKSIYFLIIAGVLLVIACTLMALHKEPSRYANILNLIFIIVQAVIGLITVVIARKVTGKFFHFFAGMLYFFWSMIYLASYAFFSWSLNQMWPLLGIVAGVLWFIAGRWKYKVLKFGYLIPSVTLFGMGLWYSLFSFGLIRLSFKSVALTLGPLFMLMVAVLLIVFFFVQQKHSELVFSDEETGIFSDEESSIKSELEVDE
jgi:hypothetical protein